MGCWGGALVEGDGGTPLLPTVSLAAAAARLAMSRGGALLL